MVTYDGKVAELRVNVMEKLGLDVTQAKKVLDAKLGLMEEYDFNNIESCVYLDVNLCGIFYRAIIVGNWGVAIPKGDDHESLMQIMSIDRVLTFSSKEDLANLKQPIFSKPMARYCACIDALIKPTELEDLPSLQMSYSQFINTDLWKRLDELRGYNCEAFKAKEAYRLIKNGKDTQSTMSEEWQGRILKEWESYLYSM